MEEKDIRGFSLPALLLVTGFCFLSFGLVLRILDGVSMTFFLDTGFITSISGILSVVCILVNKKKEKRSIS